MATDPADIRRVFGVNLEVPSVTLVAVSAEEVKNEAGDIVAYGIEGIGEVPKSVADELANFILFGTGTHVGETY